MDLRIALGSCQKAGGLGSLWGGRFRALERPFQGCGDAVPFPTKLPERELPTLSIISMETLQQVDYGAL